MAATYPGIIILRDTANVTTWLTAGAAVAAALFSVINVVLTNRLTRGAQVQQWRRDSAQTIFGQVLDSARELHAELLQIDSEYKFVTGPSGQGTFERKSGRDYDSSGAKLRDGMSRMMREVEELELVASKECTLAGRDFLEFFAGASRLTNVHDKDSDAPDFSTTYSKVRDEFIAACRRDLGVGNRWKKFGSKSRR